MAESSVRTYVDRSRIFLRWLAGYYQFQGGRERDLRHVLMSFLRDEMDGRRIRVASTDGMVRS